jgi:hypothetical protein
MREFIEFRILEKHASTWLGNQGGVSVSSLVRKLDLEVTDPRIEIIAKAQRELKTKGDIFFTSCNPRRVYTRAELEAASLFRLKVSAVFDAAGELYGTTYDETTACPRCKAGAKQVGPLFLDVRRIPRGKDFAKTIAGEIVVSQRVVGLFAQYQVSGVEFHPVRRRKAKGVESTEWSQLVVTALADITAPTRIGINIFDDDPQGEYRCAAGDLIGLNVLSEISVSDASRGNTDLGLTTK